MLTRSRSLVCLCIAGFVALVACGDDDDGAAPVATEATSGGATTSAQGAEGASTTTGAGSEGTATTAAPQAADKSLAPVVFGFHNLEGGVVSLPELRQGFEAGIAYVNEELGGINGHPIEIKACNVDVTPESSVNCANQFVEAGVDVAVQGADIAADAALPVLVQAGIPEIGFYPFTPGVNHAVGDAFITGISVEEYLAAGMKAMKDLGVTRLAGLVLDVPAAHQYEATVGQPLAKKLGLDLTQFYNQPQTDWTTFGAVVVASNPEGIAYPAPQEQECLGAIPAFRAAGFTGPIIAGSCVQYLEQLDENLLEDVYNTTGLYFTNFTEVPAGPQQDIDIYQRYMERLYPDFQSPLYTQLGFHTAVTAADMVRQTKGDLTAANIKASLPNAKGHSFFDPTGYDCSKPVWPGTTACGSNVIFTRATPDRKMEEVDFSPIDISDVVP